jgi:curved DNA-binding protein CbpA
MDDFYSVLRIPSNATLSQIEKAYKTEALLNHPDKNPVNKDNFPLIQQAYDVLRDPDTRTKYDQNVKIKVLILYNFLTLSGCYEEDYRFWFF